MKQSELQSLTTHYNNAKNDPEKRKSAFNTFQQINRSLPISFFEKAKNQFEFGRAITSNNERLHLFGRSVRYGAKLSMLYSLMHLIIVPLCLTYKMPSLLFAGVVYGGPFVPFAIGIIIGVFAATFYTKLDSIKSYVTAGKFFLQGCFYGIKSALGFGKNSLETETTKHNELEPFGQKAILAKLIHQPERDTVSQQEVKQVEQEQQTHMVMKTIQPTTTKALLTPQFRFLQESSRNETSGGVTELSDVREPNGNHCIPQ